jgi:phosphatidylglycerophosphatase A
MTMMTAPNLRFLFSNPLHFLALGFGTGLSRIAPGTMGTLIAAPIFYALMQTPEVIHYVVITTLFLIGIPICAVAGRHLGVTDHSGIVWDEIVAFLLVLEFTTLSWQWWITAFLLFRLFDIWKPFPISYFDAKFKDGFGVMFDDLVAALFAIACMKGLQWWMLTYSI